MTVSSGTCQPERPGTHGDGVTDAAAGLTCVVGVGPEDDAAGDDDVGDGAAVGAADEVGALGVALVVAVDRGRDGRLDADFVGLVGPAEGLESVVLGETEGVVRAGMAVITCVTASSTRVAWAPSS